MLVGIDAWGRRERDLRGAFAAAYVVVNRAILDELNVGAFGDPCWIRALVRDFGERYRCALRGHLGSRHAARLPACWSLALAFRRGDGGAAVGSLVLGMVAHIRHDLALSLHACGGLDRVRTADYERLGETICRTTPAIQREVIAGYAPDLADVHHRLRGLDTRIANHLVRRWRRRASQIATRMGDQVDHQARWAQRLRGESAALALAALPLARLVRALAAEGEELHDLHGVPRTGTIEPVHETPATRPPPGVARDDRRGRGLLRAEQLRPGA